MKQKSKSSNVLQSEKDDDVDNKLFIRQMECSTKRLLRTHYHTRKKLDEKEMLYCNAKQRTENLTSKDFSSSSSEIKRTSFNDMNGINKKSSSKYALHPSLDKSPFQHNNATLMTQSVNTNLSPEKKKSIASKKLVAVCNCTMAKLHDKLDIKKEDTQFLFDIRSRHRCDACRIKFYKDNLKLKCSSVDDDSCIPKDLNHPLAERLEYLISKRREIFELKVKKGYEVVPETDSMESLFKKRNNICGYISSKHDSGQVQSVDPSDATRYFFSSSDNVSSEPLVPIATRTNTIDYVAKNEAKLFRCCGCSKSCELLPQPWVSSNYDLFLSNFIVRQILSSFSNNSSPFFSSSSEPCSNCSIPPEVIGLNWRSSVIDSPCNDICYDSKSIIKLTEQSSNAVKACSIFLQQLTRDKNEQILKSKRFVSTVLTLEHPVYAPNVIADDSNKMLLPQYYLYDETKSSKMVPLINSKFIDDFSDYTFKWDHFIPPAIFILNAATTEIDWQRSCDTLYKQDDFLGDTLFRIKCWSHAIFDDDMIASRIYGVSEQGVTSNDTRRKMFEVEKNNDPTVKDLNQRRTSSNYKHILESPFKNKDGGIPGDSSFFTVHMKAYKVSSVNRIMRYGEYLKYKNDKRLHEQEEERQRAFNQKLKTADSLLQKKLENKLKAMKIQVENSSIAINKKRGEDLGCMINESVWQKRMSRSIIKSKQTINFEVWEERIDTGDKRIFYHCSSNELGDKKINSWQPPEGWILNCDDGDDFPDQEIMDTNVNKSEKEELNGSEGQNLEENSKHSNINEIAKQLANDTDFVNALIIKLGAVFEKKQQENDSVSKESSESSFSHQNTIRDYIMRHYCMEVQDDESADVDVIKGSMPIPETVILPKKEKGVIKSFQGENITTIGIESIKSHQEQKDDDDLIVEGKECWRDLVKCSPDIQDDFFQQNKRQTEKCRSTLANIGNSRKMIGIVKSPQVMPYEVDDTLICQKATQESYLIKDIMKDINRIIKAKELREKREEMILNCPDEVALQQILNEQPSAFTSIERAILEEPCDDTNEQESLYTKIRLAVKNSNFEELVENIDIFQEKGLLFDVDLQDEYGNTLFILACQQANKKMIKVLLRTYGASLNAQNYTGNTGLHYLYEYDHIALAEYLIEKGADDTILNADGLTCYEGLNHESISD